MAIADFTLTFDDFDALRTVILNHCGIWLGESKLSFLQLRLAERLRARNISTAQEYYYFIKYDPQGSEELQQLIDAITINETWFFRETGPVEAWLATILPELLKKQGGTLSLWSAGCATGEEPYTLAMLLLDAQRTSARRFSILATDISQQALEAARNASYDPYSLRRTEERWQKQYFQPDGLRYLVNEEARRMVHFGQANLVDNTLAQRIQKMDLILCRNVLIYLSDAGRAVALDTFYRALKPGGHLILGHSESLIHVRTSFEIARLEGKILYRK
ncbi:MAG: protein-glutamate O-methyltransferase CheR [Anaerolineae bacterium]|nr:protein-glutamate O-methyltransferase CheR [Anaerolineae bacterium]